jgi:hypothetical protein
LAGTDLPGEKGNRTARPERARVVTSAEFHTK